MRSGRSTASARCSDWDQVPQYPQAAKFCPLRVAVLIMGNEGMSVISHKSPFRYLKKKLQNNKFKICHSPNAIYTLVFWSGCRNHRPHPQSRKSTLAASPTAFLNVSIPPVHTRTILRSATPSRVTIHTDPAPK